jgi:hypothetical protein
MWSRESTAMAFEVIKVQDQADNQGEKHPTDDTDAND